MRTNIRITLEPGWFSLDVRVHESDIGSYRRNDVNRRLNDRAVAFKVTFQRVCHYPHATRYVPGRVYQ